LAVDRSVIFENLKAVKAWVPVDGRMTSAPARRIAPREQEEAYPVSRCNFLLLLHGSLPQFNDDTGFVGAATIAQ